MCLDKIAPVDVEENNIIELQPEILAGLLKDRSTGKNIIWATDDYSHLHEVRPLYYGNSKKALS